MASSASVAATVLVVESNPAIYRWVADLLLSTGLTIRHAPDMATAVFALATGGPFEAVICGNGPVNQGGRELLHWMRQEGIGVPVLFIGPKTVKRPGDQCATLKAPFISTQLLETMGRILPNPGASWNRELMGNDNAA
jgi:DNA-binding NtrC family response regulator